MPLGFVDYERSDGHLLGLAIAIPRNFERTDELFKLLGRHDGNAGIETGVPFLLLAVRNPEFEDRVVGKLELELDERPMSQRQFSLKSFSWTQPSRFWTTITPLILAHHPGPGATAEEIVVKECVVSGYPEPMAVRTSQAPLLLGVPHAREFESKGRQRRPPRPLMHAQIEFARDVRGPVLIGPGRCAGYGTFRPIWKGGAA
jgi:CRISPR-associated protein Csb2